MVKLSLLDYSTKSFPGVQRKDTILKELLEFLTSRSSENPANKFQIMEKGTKNLQFPVMFETIVSFLRCFSR